MAITLCDSCKSTSASLYCKPDSAFLCIPCDNKIHAANKLASRHDRVWLCEVCERAPAYVTCKADNATLCVACDRDIHSANPLARRHERFPVASLTDPVNDYVNVVDVNGAGNEADEADEAEAALWLNKTEDEDIKVTRYETEPEPEMETKCFFNDVDPYVGLDLKTPDRKGERIVRGYNSQTDGVVPVQNTLSFTSDYVVEGLPAYDVDYAGSKPFMYNFTSQSISQSVSSSSLEVEAGVVPDKSGAMGDVTNNSNHQSSTPEVYPAPLLGLDREARVLRYREKKKNRKFEKTIRYASRKAYAEKRPRIKGRFAKRTEIDVEVDHAIVSPDSSYGVVPSY